MDGGSFRVVVWCGAREAAQRAEDRPCCCVKRMISCDKYLCSLACLGTLSLEYSKPPCGLFGLLQECSDGGNDIGAQILYT